MKVGQNSIIRWVGKLFAKTSQEPAAGSRRHLRTLEEAQLRHVGGGTSDSPSTPTKTW